MEDGKLGLDADVNGHLKSWQLPDNEFTAKQKVTLRQILNHTAGLTVWGFPGYERSGKVPSVLEVLEGKGNTDAVRVFKMPGGVLIASAMGQPDVQLAPESNTKFFDRDSGFPVEFVEENGSMVAIVRSTLRAVRQ